jgi:3-deoxy-7-phosphoheptulonate synthase
VLIDCSHGNSRKDYRLQPAVFRDVISNVAPVESGLLGVMLESHLVEGKQAVDDDLVYGKSITDGCIGWEETEALLREVGDVRFRQQ